MNDKVKKSSEQEEQNSTQKEEGKTTPMMAQYFALKKENEGYLLFYRMGDFYEMFFQDAIVASAELDIALTKRNKEKGQDIPMCGVPVHSHEAYLSRLIKKGFKVAICEQMEDPAQARKERGANALVKREVVRLITPGTLTEDNILEPRVCHFIIALTQTSEALGLAWADVSTGDFRTQSLPLKNTSQLMTAISRLDPKEIVVNEKVLQTPEFFELFNEYKRLLTPLPPPRFSYENGKERLETFFKVKTLDAFGLFDKSQISAAGALLDYIALTQKGQMPRLNPLKLYQTECLMQIDAATRKNLEIFYSFSGEKKATLFHTIDNTLTGAGARLLSLQLSSPLLHVNLINKRLDRVEFFLNNPLIRSSVRDRLCLCADMERALARLSVGRGGPRDLAVLKNTLVQIPDMKTDIQSDMGLPLSLKECLESFYDLTPLVEKLAHALGNDLPLLPRQGGFIAPLYSKELDELKNFKEVSQRTLWDLQMEYIDVSGVQNLKISHNNMLGYYIEVPARYAQKMLDEARAGQSIFIHRQTMANAIRFTTPALADLEAKLKTVAERTLNLELALFEELVQEVLKKSHEISKNAQTFAMIDVAAGLAETAHLYDYCRPVLEDSLAFDIVQGRHSVVEKMIRQNNEKVFVKNDCHLGNVEKKEGRLWLMTGPNMAGKSTFLRQNALIAIMAQAGGFVPAQKAKIGIVDKVFSRVGAGDDLARGRSTFMVEMIETATILNQATKRSLVILDEIGRGTATFDGLSIAWAVVEHLHDVNKSRALFATHYHELVALSEKLTQISLHTMKIKEWKEEIIFLHEAIKGSADRSYGIHVGALAGLPKEVIKRAKEVLIQLEKQGAYEINFMNDLPLFSMIKKPKVHQEENQLPEEITQNKTAPLALDVFEKIKRLNPDELTPKEALSFLYDLKQISEEKNDV